MSNLGRIALSARAGDLLCLAGQVGTLPDGTTVSPEVGAQTTQAISNMRDVLRSHGLDLENLVQVTVYLTDMSAFDEMNAAYFAAFEGVPQLPPRATVGVSALYADYKVELVPLAYG